MDTLGLEAVVIDAFNGLNIEARAASTGPGRGVDLVLDPTGLNISVAVKYRSLVTDLVAERLLTEPRPSGTTLLVVANRVTDAGRHVLTNRGSGYLDLRGRLALRTQQLMLDTDVEPIKPRSERTTALSGKAGLEVATAVLMQPERPPSVRELAREVKRSASTVSEVLAALRRQDLLDENNSLSGTDLFWHLAEHWPTSRVHLAQLPGPGDTHAQLPLRLGLDTAEPTPGWALTDTAAAAIYGAPVAFRDNQRLDFFVPDQTIIRRATTLLGAAPSATNAAASLRIAPVPAIVERRVDLDTNPTRWPLAHPLFVALDLAQDTGRGREILDTWTPDDRWTRVW